MTFKQLQESFKEEFGITKLADIARELGVTPQVVSNWKSKNQLPYKYVKRLYKKIKKKKSEEVRFDKSITVLSPEQFTSKDNDSSEDISIFQLLNQFYHLSVKNIFIVIFFPLFIAILSAVYIKFYVPNKYESQFKIIPTNNSQSTLPQISGLTSQFNLNPADLKSGLYFPDIMMSRNMLIRLLDKKFKVQNFPDEGKTLLSIFTGLPSNSEIKNSSPIQVAKSLKTLQKQIRVKTKKNNNISTINVLTNNPELSFKIGKEIINLLNQILREFEENRAKSKKEFILSRILEEQINLAAMEDKLRVFREKNREIRKSPSLQLEEARLQRDVQVKTQVFITLKQQNEMTQINSFDNASYVHIIDSSGIPIKRKGPQRAKFVIISYILGLMIIYSFLIAKNYYPVVKENIKSAI